MKPAGTCSTGFKPSHTLVKPRHTLAKPRQTRSHREFKAAASKPYVESEDVSCIYKSKVFSPKPCAHGVEVQQVEGKGLGLFATTDISMGSLILISHPIGMVFGPKGQIPSNDDLAATIHARELSAHELAWLSVLRANDDTETTSSKTSSTKSNAAGDRASSSTTSTSTNSSSSRLRLVQSLLCPDTSNAMENTPENMPETMLESNPAAVRTADEEGGLGPSSASSGTSASNGGAEASGDGTATGGANGSAVASEGLNGSAAATEVANDSAQSAAGDGISAAANDGADALLVGSNGAHATASNGTPAQLLVGSVPLRISGLELPSVAASVSYNSGLELTFVAGAVSCNSYGEVSEDLAVSELRDEDPEAFVGLWPEFALLNHSCAPNTSLLVVGGVLMLRAARTIPEGDEVTTSYLANSCFTPVASRRSVLRSQYGFHCSCRRCLLEHQLFPTRRYSPDVEKTEVLEAKSILAAASPTGRYGSVLQTVLDVVFGPGRFRTLAAKDNLLLQNIEQRLAIQLESETQAALTAFAHAESRRSSVMRQLNGLVLMLNACLNELALDERSAMLIRASVYPMYRLRAELAEAGNVGTQEEQVEALLDCQQVLDAVARGSDTHLFLAAKSQARARAVFSAYSPNVRAADLSLARAYKARYGEVDKATMQALAQARARLSMGSSMAWRISTMAWDDTINLERAEEML